MNVVCKYGLYHHKEVKEGEPSSNNGWIYSAIAETLGFPIDRALVHETFKGCTVLIAKNYILIDRLPGKTEPPLSHDEIMGMYLLGFIHFETLKGNKFVFRDKGEKMGIKVLFQFLIGAIELGFIALKNGKSHRNDFWKYKIWRVNQLAYRLMPHYTYFLKVHNGEKPSWFERMFWKISSKETIKNGSPGLRNILHLMAQRIEDTEILKQLNEKENLVQYFGDNHPIAIRAKELL